MIFKKINYFLYDCAISTRVWFEANIINFSSKNDISKITNNIYVGNLSTSTNKELLIKNGITHIICIMSQPKAHFPKDFTYLSINAYDIPEYDLTYSFPISNSFIDEVVKNDKKVYVHCMCGASRSVSLVLSYLMWKYPETSLEEHLANIMTRREQAKPNIGFLEQLRAYKKSLTN